MKLSRLDSTAHVAAPLDEVWDFFSNPRNLPVITPPWLGLQLTSEPPPQMHPGLIITYNVRPIAGIPLGWVTEITHVVDHELFVDEQRSGPYRFWHHQHHFKAVEGGTEMRDLVHWALPMGPLGNLVVGRDVRRRISGIFEFRANVIRQRFGPVSPLPAPSAPATLEPAPG